MIRIKICGVTRVGDAVAAVDAGADAIGLNFYPPSPRSLDLETAATIAREVAARALVVGVFVNEAASRIGEIADAVGLAAIQLHGDEPAELLGELPVGLPVIRAARVGPPGFDAQLAKFRDAPRQPDAWLVDAPMSPAGEYGGTGRRADWGAVAREQTKLAPTPLVLAGGLTADNVAEAIHAVRPAGVDTASGVEASPGVKDAGRMRRFVAAAAAALAN